MPPCGSGFPQRAAYEIPSMQDIVNAIDPPQPTVPTSRRSLPPPWSEPPNRPHQTPLFLGVSCQSRQQPARVTPKARRFQIVQVRSPRYRSDLSANHR